MVNGEGVGEAVGIDFDTAIGDGLEFQAVAVDRFDQCAEFVCRAVMFSFPPI